MEANNPRKEMSISIAKKHIQICIGTKKIFQNNHPELSVYIATHSGKLYNDLGKLSGKDFWSLQLRSSLDNKGLKNPDIIVTNGKKVKYFIEVKWGAIEGCSVSDSDIKTIIKGSEKDKMKRARKLGGDLKCNGPAITNSQHYYNTEFLENEVFFVNKESKFLLVSDFQMMKEVFDVKDYEDILFQLKRQSDIFQIADINKKVDDVPSLEDII